MTYISNDLSNHPKFTVPYDIYRWYSECSYNTSKDKLLELLEDSENIRDKYENGLSKIIRLPIGISKMVLKNS